jgi:hypothetical protein
MLLVDCRQDLRVALLALAAAIIFAFAARPLSKEFTCR